MNFNYIFILIDESKKKINGHIDKNTEAKLYLILSYFILHPVANRIRS